MLCGCAGLVLLGASGAVLTIPTAALILGKAAIIGAGQSQTNFYF